MRDKRANPPATVVCVHGAGGGGWEWAIWARVLAARGFAVIAPDLQPVAAGIEATRLADYSAQVLQWCRGVDAPVVLVGASLGGRLALLTARAAGASALVLVNPLPPEGLAGPHPPRPPRVPWGRERSLARTRRALPDADAAARLYAFRRWRDESGAALDEACAGFPLEPQACPVLLLASECDDDVPAASSRALAAALAADFELLTAATHVGPLLGRSAAATAERVARWIEQARLAGSAAHENLAAL
ncbi:MAG TPA: alpha/beta hydrolase family protein [Dokdonella sp.]